MTHIPFILFNYKNELEPLWTCIESLLQIMQILYSRSISENDVKTLEKLIEAHLSSVIEIFKQGLTPKQHFLTHYPSLIRLNGPVIHNWCMRMEGKHRFFTEIADRNNQYGNVPFTLSQAHQKHMAEVEFPLKNTYNPAKIRKTVEQNILDIIDEDGTCIQIDKVYSINFLEYNDFQYRPGLMLVHSNTFYEIVHILSNSLDYWFVCLPYEAIRFDKFLNSLEVKKLTYSHHIVMKHSDLENKLSYEIKYLLDSKYIQSNTLELKASNFLSNRN